jgi:anti-sigma factor RsiW
MTTDLAPDDEMIATLSDYLDGALPESRRAEVQAKIASDAEWKRTYEEIRETRDTMSGLLKARAPAKFDEDVTATIHKRSAGRFFGKRTFGDRVPLVPLLVVGIVALLAIGWYLWSSPTGSLKSHRHVEPQGSGVIVPKP